jgi:hypothetical protein
MLGTVRYQINVNRPAAEVWDLVGAPERMSEWFPDFVSSTVEGNIRTVRTANGIPIPEEILVCDSILRRFQYRLDLPIVTHHRGTIDVLDLGDATTLIVYATEADPRIMALVIGAATARALREIKRQLEEEN